ncbi:ABC transporter permease [Prosthecomicrobium pneumaticum]|uniref:NitT/TauT family transport system permease protein n=1 Tax=Prosthecomicrobium pneumaticum TaxID=81895 RepID=A0A7W9L291_9HYPH|nr:ABC transporter permease [Prosthecomicrobium pneumaticum]MBB5753322.1 NitT/TauT family transport system permease protein [Prosthecomicrobium pneumaticum]
MTAVRGLLQPWLILPLMILAVVLPLDAADPASLLPRQGPFAWTALVALGAAAVAAAKAHEGPSAGLLVLAFGTVVGALFALDRLPAIAGHPGPGYLAFAAATWLAAWALVSELSAMPTRAPAAAFLMRLLVPALFGLTLLVAWEILIVAFAVPAVLLPPPSAIGARIAVSIPTLAADFRQTFLKAVVAGYAIGCGAGFLVAILVDRVPFLARGLLPVGNLVSALPIVGIAPILVMWFGFDWQSKAAVVVVMTFFPMLVNTVAGLAAADPMSRDLMRTYAAGYWTSLLKLRLPVAMPFIFNALKINSTLALIGAIVAEFFGTPIVGMGFRISTEVGRMNIDMVWAEIAVAALAGSAFYGAVALVERVATFWHPSFRR